MTVASTSPLVKGFKFGKNLPFLNQKGSLGFQVSSGGAPDVAAALLSDTAPFPARDVDLAEIALTASTAAPIEFARGTDKVSFTASGGVFAGFGIYRTGGALLQRLGDRAEDFSLDALEFGSADAGVPSVMSVLRWGFSAEAKASGAVALGPAGAATLDVSGNSEGLFAVIRRLPSSTPARSVIQATADSWVLPRQITSIGMVAPGTWIASEVIGGLKIGLGAQLGFDFNWVREAELGGLTGDIGLRLQVGIDAAVGFTASGRCAVVVSRESAAPMLRVRFFRLKSRGSNASFNASVTAELRDTILPGKVDDFIAAVFDTHGQQILRDLQVLEKWTDPKKSLSELLAEAGVEGAEKLVARMAGVSPERLQQEFDAVHARAVSFIQKWHALPHRVSSSVLKLVGEKVDLTEVRQVAQELKTITTERLRDLLDERLNRAEFFHTPVGRILESLGGESVLGLLQKPVTEINTLASTLLGVLDGSAVEQTLQSFQGFVEHELQLDRIFEVVTDTDFAGLDLLLKRKLAAFLGQHAIVLQDLEKVRKAVRLLLNKRDEYYEKAVEALHRKYSFDLNAAFTSTSTDQALLDATFDFSVDPASVSAFLQQALQGNLDTLLMMQPPQVSLGTARLSHGITRQSHVTASLPFTTRTQSHLNESLASVEAVADNGGLLFTVNASDTVASNQRKSVLSLALGLSGTGPQGTGVRVHQNTFELNYSMVFARRNMQEKHVRAVIEPAVRTYFAKKIPDTAAFIELLDRQTEAVIPNGPNLLGSGLISLQVSMAAEAAANAGEAWLTLPADRKSDVYGSMSRAIQASLKSNVHDSFFTGPDAYTDSIVTAHIVMAYCAIVPTAPKVTSSFGLPFWNFADGTQRQTMLGKRQTVAKMTELLQRASETLRGESDAQFFRPADAASILGAVDQNGALLQGLLFSEAELVKHAFEAGLKIASSQGATPSEAVKALATFGAKLTQAFNSDVTALLGRGIQTIGTRLFLDTSRAIDPSRADGITEANAMLNIEFLKPESRFDRAELLTSGRIAAGQLALADTVVALAPA